MSWTYTRRVKYYETDRMGVVHHSNYLRLLEDARMEWFNTHIIPYRELEAMGVVIPVIAARGNFKIFLRFDDPFAVEMRMTFYNGVRMTVAYEVRNTDTGELCYDGETEHCFVSNPDYKPLALKKKFPQLHEKLMAVLEKPEKGK